jgi:hypothetical protein
MQYCCLTFVGHLILNVIKQTVLNLEKMTVHNDSICIPYILKMKEKVPAKRRLLFTTTHGVTSKKTRIFTNIALNTSHLAMTM